MLINFIIGILLASSIYYLCLAKKYENKRYTYKVKNRIYDTINIYNNLNKNVNLDDYKYLKNLLDLKANELLRIKDIKEIKQIKVYKNKENVDLNINNIIKDLMNFLNHYGKNDLEQVKEILESCIEITETILKARKPFLYYKFKLKKMKYFRILQSTVTSLRNVSSGKRYEAKLKRDIVKNKDILQYEFA